MGSCQTSRLPPCWASEPGVDHFVLCAGELTIQPSSVPWAHYNSQWFPIKQGCLGTCQHPAGVGAGIIHGSGLCVCPGTEVTVHILEDALSAMWASPAASGTRPGIVETPHRTHPTSTDYNPKHRSTQDHRQDVNSFVLWTGQLLVTIISAINSCAAVLFCFMCNLHGYCGMAAAVNVFFAVLLPIVLCVLLY